MALPDKVKQLDEQIAVAVREALKGVREELGKKIERNSEELRAQLDQLEGALPSSFLSAAEVSPIAREASEESRQEALTGLRDALVAIDSTDSQAGILGALLEEAGRFASRTALFLTRKEEAIGWGCFGFADSQRDMAELAQSYDDGQWAELQSGAGVLSLSASDCVALCNFLDSEVPTEAVLIPLVLRDRLAAALYADRVEGEGELQIEALQTLAYVAAQAVEVLPFRKRRSTPTLRHAQDDAEAAETLEAWDDPPAAEVTAATAALAAGALEQAPAPPREDTAPPREDTAPPREDAAEDRPEDSDSAELPQPAETPALDEIPDEDEEPTATGVEFEMVDDSPEEDPAELDATPAPEPEPSDDEPEPEATPPLETPSAAIGFEAPEAEMDGAATVRLEALPSLPSLLPEPEEDKPEQEVAASETLEAEIEGLSAATAPTVPEVIRPEEVPIEPTPQIEELLSPPTSPAAIDIDISEDETVLLERDSVLSTPPPASYAPPPPMPEVTPPLSTEEPAKQEARTSSEVTPPSDVDGPGWAFSTAGPATEEDEPEDGPLHDEARRLARLLVSEIRLYNEEQIEDGRRSRDIYQRVREDVERSRQIYHERVDERVASSTDYFQEALVEILAGGDPDVLGA